MCIRDRYQRRVHGNQMKIIPTFLCLFGFTICDILRPNDHFTNINYEEDMGICIGIHSNTTNMTEFEKFQAFKEHNCLPLITLEGVEGTKLQLMITDCDSLSDEVLENCNIMTEKNKHRFIWFPPADLVKCKSNVSEFLVWIAFEGDPVSLLGGGKCLSALFGAKLSELSSYYRKEPPYILSDQPGIAITWYGNTPDTMNQSNCGINAGEDLGQTDLPLGELMDWQAFYDYTLGMGYQPGLTLLPIPYDWRRQAGNHEATTTLKRSIEFAFKITGKKVVIAGHSFGCLAFLTLMNSFTQEFKDQYIDSFLGLACAWTGSTEAINWALAGENLGWKDIGYPLDDLRNLITSLTSFFDLQPKGIFNASTQWGQAISQRAEQEIEWNSANPAKDIAFPWFPTPENDCYLDRSQDSKCGLHLYDFFKNPVAYAYNDAYMLNESSIIMLMESFMLRTNDEIAFQKLIDGGKVSEEEQNQTWGTKKLIPKDRVSLMMQMVRRNGAQYPQFYQALQFIIFMEVIIKPILGITFQEIQDNIQTKEKPQEVMP
eukprot:TRINITY_DN387_c0_g2_i1.p1 TRINITY_DN387_c0_g2~~TRINITY_DN387_c0_g2_i1.p1  ORF type:complete len:553 (+),score=75.73 TRINITY_DN387_c0_g2_i1:28-1659(+)